MWYLDISNNQIKQIYSINNLKELNSFYLFNNPISNLTFDFMAPRRTQFYLSSYNSSLLNNSVNEYEQIYIFDDSKNLTNIFNQKLQTKSTKLMIKYYKSVNLITLNEMFHSDCLRTINFMKRLNFITKILS